MLYKNMYSRCIVGALCMQLCGTVILHASADEVQYRDFVRIALGGQSEGLPADMPSSGGMLMFLSGVVAQYGSGNDSYAVLLESARAQCMELDDDVFKQAFHAYVCCWQVDMGGMPGGKHGVLHMLEACAALRGEAVYQALAMRSIAQLMYLIEHEVKLVESADETSPEVVRASDLIKLVQKFAAALPDGARRTSGYRDGLAEHARFLQAKVADSRRRATSWNPLVIAGNWTEWGLGAMRAVLHKRANQR